MSEARWQREAKSAQLSEVAETCECYLYPFNVKCAISNQAERGNEPANASAFLDDPGVNKTTRMCLR